MSDSLFNIKGYSFFRNDRLHKRGGGTCCWAHNNYKPILYPPSNPTQTTDLRDISTSWVSLTTIDLLIITIYFPPNLPILLHQTFTVWLTDNLDSFLTNFPHYNYIFLGDLNNY